MKNFTLSCLYKTTESRNQLNCDRKQKVDQCLPRKSEGDRKGRIMRGHRKCQVLKKILLDSDKTFGKIERPFIAKTNNNKKRKQQTRNKRKLPQFNKGPPNLKSSSRFSLSIPT